MVDLTPEYVFDELSNYFSSKGNLFGRLRFVVSSKCTVEQKARELMYAQCKKAKKQAVLLR